jgi:hypothetical protein
MVDNGVCLLINQSGFVTVLEHNMTRKSGELLPEFPIFEFVGQLQEWKSNGEEKRTIARFLTLLEHESISPFLASLFTEIHGIASA